MLCQVQKNGGILSLINKDKSRHYCSMSKHNFDRRNFHSFITEKRKTIEGYSYNELEILNLGYDTLEFNGFFEVNCLREFVRAKEIAQLDNKECITWEYRGFNFLVNRKGFLRYTVKMNYQNLFQFAFNDKQVNIKILSVAFYTINNLEVLYRLLFDIVLTLFDVSFREEFKVSRLDFAIDIKYNFGFIGELLKKDKPDFGFKFLGKLSKVEEDKGRSVTLKSGDVQLCVYDKVFEVFQSNDEKKEIYSKLYDIDFFNKYNLLEYQKADYHIVRFEYRLLNKQKLMAKRDITIEKVFFNENYIKYLIEELIKNHTSLNHEEDNLYKLILTTDEPVEIKRVKFDEENYLFAELENCINITLSYLTSIQSKMVVLHGIENNYPGYEKMFEYMKSKLTDFDYFNKVNEKIEKIKNRKYK